MSGHAAALAPSLLQLTAHHREQQCSEAFKSNLLINSKSDAPYYPLPANVSGKTFQSLFPTPFCKHLFSSKKLSGCRTMSFFFSSGFPRHAILQSCSSFALFIKAVNHSSLLLSPAPSRETPQGFSNPSLLAFNRADNSSSEASIAVMRHPFTWLDRFPAHPITCKPRGWLSDSYPHSSSLPFDTGDVAGRVDQILELIELITQSLGTCTS